MDVAARASSAMSWRILTILFGGALALTFVIVTSTAVFKASEVRTATRDRLISSNDTSLISFANIDHLKANTLCFDDYPYCIGYDEGGDCIANGGHMCFNDVTVYGSLVFEDGGHFGGVSSFSNFSIGNFYCVQNIDGNVNCSGGTFYPGTLGLTLFFDPDHFAALRRNGDTLIIDAETLQLDTVVVGDARFANVVFVDDRIVFSNQSIIGRVGGRLMVIGLNLTEFVDNVLMSSDWTLTGRVVGSNLKFDDGINIAMYGPASEIVQRDGNLTVCATDHLRLCGNTVTIHGDTGIELDGPITNIVHFLAGLQIDGTLYLTGNEVAENFTIEYLTVMHDAIIHGYTTMDNMLRVTALITAYQLQVNGSATIGYLAVLNNFASSGLATFNGGANFLQGINVVGSVTSNILSKNVLIHTNTGNVNISGYEYTCLGIYNSSYPDINGYCSIYIPSPDDFDRCVHMPCATVDKQLNVNGPAYFTQSVSINATVSGNSTGNVIISANDYTCIGEYDLTKTDMSKRCSIYAPGLTATDRCVHIACLHVDSISYGSNENASNTTSGGCCCNCTGGPGFGNFSAGNETYDFGEFLRLNVTERVCLIRTSPNSDIWTDSCLVYADNDTQTLNVRSLTVDGMSSNGTLGVALFENNSRVFMHSCDVAAEFYNPFISYSHTYTPFTDTMEKVTFGPGKYTLPANGPKVWKFDGDVYVTGSIFASGDIDCHGDMGIGHSTDPGCEFVQNACPSDARLKRILRTVGTEESLATVNDIAIYEFEYNVSYLQERFPGPQQGVVAQELQTVFPNAVNDPTNFNPYLTVNYDKLVPVLVNAIKELTALNQALTSRVDEMQQQLDLLLQQTSEPPNR